MGQRKEEEQQQEEEEEAEKGGGAIEAIRKKFILPSLGKNK